MVWEAPVARSEGGRSADKTISGVPDMRASTTAGKAFAAAVPEVQTNRAGAGGDAGGVAGMGAETAAETVAETDADADARVVEYAEAALILSLPAPSAINAAARSSSTEWHRMPW